MALRMASFALGVLVSPAQPLLGAPSLPFLQQEKPNSADFEIAARSQLFLTSGEIP